MTNPHDKFAVAVIKVSQIEGQTLSENLFHTNYVVFYYMQSFCHPLSIVCHITGRRKKGEGLEVQCKHNYYGSTKDLAFIRDPAFIFVIMLAPQPLYESRPLYKTGRNSRQYGIHLSDELYGAPQFFKTTYVSQLASYIVVNNTTVAVYYGDPS